MKLLHFADLHLGVDNYGSMDSTTGVSTRVTDFLNALDAIIDRAIDEPVDAVLFAGDAFKHRDPNSTLQREFARRVHRLAEAHIPIVLLAGNHDLPAVQHRATPTEIFDALEIPYVYVCLGIDLFELDTRNGPLQIVAVPWVNRSNFMESRSYRILADQRLDESITEAITLDVQALAKDLDPEKPAVLLAHISLVGATYGLERSIMIGDDLRLGMDDIRISAFDYVALGHIHKHQQLRANPPVVYAGSPERIDFGEENEKKGYILLEISEPDDGQRFTTWEFVELPARPFVTLRIEAYGDRPLDEVTRAIRTEGRRLDGAIVRCFVKVAPGQEASVSPREIRQLLSTESPAHISIVSVESDSRDRIRIPVPAEEALDPTLMLGQWVEFQKLTGEFKEQVLSIGQELIDQLRAEGR